MPACPNCASVACAYYSWDEVFCICDGSGGCVPGYSAWGGPPPQPANPFSGTPQLQWATPNADTVQGLIGEYKTDPGSVSAISSDFGSQTQNILNPRHIGWSNLNNLLFDAPVDVGPYATVSYNYSSPAVPGGESVLTDYIWTHGYNFNIPSGATILGIAVAIKGNRQGYAVQSDGTVLDLGTIASFATALWNIGLTDASGTTWFMGDPNPMVIDQFDVVPNPPYYVDPFGINAAGYPHVSDFPIGFGYTSDQISFKYGDSIIVPVNTVVGWNFPGVQPPPGTPPQVPTQNGYMMYDWMPGNCPVYPSEPGAVPGGSFGPAIFGPTPKTLIYSQLKTNWTAEEINSTNFGVFFNLLLAQPGSSTFGANQTVNIKSVAVAVYYTPGSGTIINPYAPPPYKREQPRITIARPLWGGTGIGPRVPAGYGLGVQSVMLDTTSIAVGGVANGTITLNQPAPAGGIQVGVAANPSIGTVSPTLVTIAAGSSTGTFTVTGAGTGTTSVTAAYNSTSQTIYLTVTGTGGGSTINLVDWWVMPTNATNHMGPSAPPTNPIYTYLDPSGNKLWHMKGSTGNPWDIEALIGGHICHWITENGDQNAWNNPQAYKRYITPVPIAPQSFVLGSTVTIDTPGQNPLVRTLNCEADMQPQIHIGDIRGVTYGPNPIDFGGDVGVQPCIITDYLYNGNNGVFKSRERYHVTATFGLVRWDLSSLQPDGSWAISLISLFNMYRLGGSPAPNFPCSAGPPPWWF